MEATHLTVAEQIEAVTLAIVEEKNPDTINRLQNHLTGLLERATPDDLYIIN